MITKYKATEGTLSYLFETEAQADAFIASDPNFIKGTFEVSLNDHYAQVFQKAKAFGKTLLDTFLLDNWQSAVPFTAEMSNALLTKFATIKQLCELGDIKTISALLPTIAIDTIYTQARKDKYIALVNDFVTANY